MAELTTKDVVIAAAEKLDELVKSHYELKGQITGMIGNQQDHELRIRRNEELVAHLATVPIVQADHESRIRRMERFRYSMPKAATVLSVLSILGVAGSAIATFLH